jgi:histidinol dehydrogenase
MALTIARYTGAEALERLTRRGTQPEPKLPRSITDRNAEIFGKPMTAHEVVAQVIEDVRADGDAAVRRYTELFDNRALEYIEVSRDEWERALEAIDPELRAAMELAAGRIRAFHERQERQ